MTSLVIGVSSGYSDVDGQGVAAVRWRWTNWCGGAGVRAEVVDLDRPGGGQDLGMTPRCTDRSRPSVIRVERRLSD
jgi:hypothetical protein